MDTTKTPHKPDVYIGGVEIVRRWVGDFQITKDEIFSYCEREVDSLEVFDLCMRMIVCIEEYEDWWKRVNEEKTP